MEQQNANAETFRDCLYALEVRQWMIMRALDDLGSDGVPIQNPKGSVNWEAYQQLYLEYHEQQQAAAEAPADAHPAEAVIFGG